MNPTISTSLEQFQNLVKNLAGSRQVNRVKNLVTQTETRNVILNARTSQHHPIRILAIRTQTGNEHHEDDAIEIALETIRINREWWTRIHCRELLRTCPKSQFDLRSSSNVEMIQVTVTCSPLSIAVIPPAVTT